MLKSGPYDYLITIGIRPSIRIEICHFRFLNLAASSFYIFDIDEDMNEYNRLKQLLERYAEYK